MFCLLQKRHKYCTAGSSHQPEGVGAAHPHRYCRVRASSACSVVKSRVHPGSFFSVYRILRQESSVLQSLFTTPYGVRWTAVSSQQLPAEPTRMCVKQAQVGCGKAGHFVQTDGRKKEAESLVSTDGNPCIVKRKQTLNRLKVLV